MLFFFRHRIVLNTITGIFDIPVSLIVVLGFFCANCSNDRAPSGLYSNKKSEIILKEEDTLERFSSAIVDTAALSTFISNSNVRMYLTGYGEKFNSTKARIITKFGVIQLKLYEDTPLHRANFVMLANRNYFDSTLFYRVIPDFMIQGGNSDRDDMTSRMAMIGNYQVPEEILSHHIHKRGALAMAVSDQYFTPEAQRHKNSSPYNFYIVQHKKYSEKRLNAICEKNQQKLSDFQRETYLNVGGAPHLDNNYTVFGEVVSGMEIVDKIAKLPTDAQDRPRENIYLRIELMD